MAAPVGETDAALALPLSGVRPAARRALTALVRGAASRYLACDGRRGCHQRSSEAALAAEEARLARAAAAGDGHAFATLYERYERRAYNLAYRLTASEDDAADAVQDAFVNVLRRLPKLEATRARLRLLPLHRDAQRQLRPDAEAQRARSRATRSPRRPRRSARRRPAASASTPATPTTTPTASCCSSPAGRDPRRQRAAAGAPARGARPARARGPLLRRDRRDHGDEPQLGGAADLAGADQPARRAARRGARRRSRPRRPSASARCR